jgi:acetyl esterase
MIGETSGDGLADEGLAAYIDGVRAAAAPSAREQGAPNMRAGAARRTAARPAGPELPAIVDLTVAANPEVPVRLYRSRLDPQPLLVYFHGGGWTIGGLDSHDRICRRLALESGVAVLAVDYRRGPEHPWPAAVEDALNVVRWARAEAPALVGSDHVGVAGDSAGGTIAALCCLRLRDAGELQPIVQVLVYPNTDLTFAQPSVQDKATGWGLDSDDAIWFAEQWVADPAMRTNSRVSPLFEPNLAGLAPAIVVTAEHDPLRDEGNAYAGALSAAGVRVVHRVEIGEVHGFLGLDTVSGAAAAAGARLAAEIRAAFSGREDWSHVLAP